jgi:hypothetical protein
MLKRRAKTISEIFEEGKPIDAAVRRAVRRAIARNVRAPRVKSSVSRRARRRRAA